MSLAIDNTKQDHIIINKNLWNNKVDLHVNSEFYKMDKFLAGRSSLNTIELDLLGDIEGKRILHLQCHFGQDTISLSRMGASVTGIDFSEKAILKAKELNNNESTETRFICCDIYDLQKQLNEKFDIIYAS